MWISATRTILRSTNTNNTDKHNIFTAICEIPSSTALTFDRGLFCNTAYLKKSVAGLAVVHLRTSGAMNPMVPAKPTYQQVLQWFNGKQDTGWVR